MYLGLGTLGLETLAMSNPGKPGQGKVPRLRYPGFGTLAMRNPGKPR